MVDSRRVCEMAGRGKEVLQSMIGEKAYTGGDGWFVWTQEKVDETIALYEDNLQKIKDGMKLSKSSDDAVELQWHILRKI